ncbi:hypothetical protein C6A85_11725, partial [Mycobacterium sp. ITM-2017-0098]
AEQVLRGHFHVGERQFGGVLRVEADLVEFAAAFETLHSALDDTLQYAKERKAFGRPIGSQQNSRFLLAELSTEATVVRMMV